MSKKPALIAYSVREREGKFALSEEDHDEFWWTATRPRRKSFAFEPRSNLSADYMLADPCPQGVLIYVYGYGSDAPWKMNIDRTPFAF